MSGNNIYFWSIIWKVHINIKDFVNQSVVTITKTVLRQKKNVLVDRNSHAPLNEKVLQIHEELYFIFIQADTLGYSNKQKLW